MNDVAMDPDVQLRHPAFPLFGGGLPMWYFPILGVCLLVSSISTL